MGNILVFRGIGERNLTPRLTAGNRDRGERLQDPPREME